MSIEEKLEKAQKSEYDKSKEPHYKKAYKSFFEGYEFCRVDGKDNKTHLKRIYTAELYEAERARGQLIFIRLWIIAAFVISAVVNGICVSVDIPLNQMKVLAVFEGTYIVIMVWCAYTIICFYSRGLIKLRVSNYKTGRLNYLKASLSSTICSAAELVLVVILGVSYYENNESFWLVAIGHLVCSLVMFSGYYAEKKTNYRIIEW